MTVVRLPVRGQWAWDVRGEGRAVRISAHVESGLINLSVWRHDVCVGTVRLLPSEVANLMAGLSEGLAEMARHPGVPADATSDDEGRLRSLEERLTRVESGLPSWSWRDAVGRAAQSARGWFSAVPTRAVRS